MHNNQAGKPGDVMWPHERSFPSKYIQLVLAKEGKWLLSLDEISGLQCSVVSQGGKLLLCKSNNLWDYFLRTTKRISSNCKVYLPTCDIGVSLLFAALQLMWSHQQISRTSIMSFCLPKKTWSANELNKISSGRRSSKRVASKWCSHTSMVSLWNIKMTHHVVHSETEILCPVLQYHPNSSRYQSAVIQCASTQCEREC